MEGEVEIVSVPAVEEELVITGVGAGRVVEIVWVAIAVSVVVSFVAIVSVVVVWLLVVKEPFDSSIDSLSQRFCSRKGITYLKNQQYHARSPRATENGKRTEANSIATSFVVP